MPEDEPVPDDRRWKDEDRGLAIEPQSPAPKRSTRLPDTEGTYPPPTRNRDQRQQRRKSSSRLSQNGTKTTASLSSCSCPSSRNLVRVSLPCLLPATNIEARFAGSMLPEEIPDRGAILGLARCLALLLSRKPRLLNVLVLRRRTGKRPSCDPKPPSRTGVAHLRFHHYTLFRCL